MWYLIFLVLLSSNGLAMVYKAAVIEYYPEKDKTAQDTILKNLERYRSLADTARSQSVDIIVFPEYGLTTFVTDPEEYSLEISPTNHIIKELSDTASARQMYLVVNLLEKSTENNQVEYYNTNLVFDRNGNIIAKYHKMNLVNEDGLSPGSKDQNLTFTTDFGVTFGIFTCFDILFRVPSRTVLENGNVTDIIFPTAWRSKMPFYTSLSVQHGYAVANGVNLLAANYGKPRDGHGGSGIYLADGKIAESYVSDSPSSKPIIQDVPKQSTRRDTTICTSFTPFGLPGGGSRLNVSDYVTGKIFNASLFNFQHLDLSQKTSSVTICGDGEEFCCTFNISVDTSQTSTDIYKLVAFDGEMDFGPEKAHIRICSLLVCGDESDSSCGARLNSTTKFTKITVEGNLPKDNTSYYTPVTLNTFLLPSTQVLFCDTKNGTNSTFVQLKTTRTHQDLLVFGLFGRTDVPVRQKIDAPDADPGVKQKIDVPYADPDNSSGEEVRKGLYFILLLVLVKYVIN